MNTSADAIPDSPPGPPLVAPVAISPARCLYWLVRRELWEHRSIYLAPLAVAAVCLVGFFISLRQLPDSMRAALALAPVQQQEAIERSCSWASNFWSPCSTVSMRCTESAAIAVCSSGNRCRSPI